jgi:hypothetical protein
MSCPLDREGQRYGRSVATGVAVKGHWEACGDEGHRCLLTAALSGGQGRRAALNSIQAMFCLVPTSVSNVKVNFIALKRFNLKGLLSGRQS